MSLRLEMLQVARLAPTLLQQASDPIADYLLDQLDDEGGARDRAGESDLYYTVFALEGLSALQAEVPRERVGAYLEGFGDGDRLDLVHLACLARCWAAIGTDRAPAGALAGLHERLGAYRTADGGFAGEPGAEAGTAYDAFLAVGAHQDLGREIADRDRLLAGLAALATPGGGFANQTGMELATVPTTAAVVALLRNLGESPPQAAGAWLLSQASREGGFFAVPGAPMPDLLSTATALHALAGLEVDFEPLKERCLDFVDTLWTGQGFCGTWADDEPDVEYTYYGLLALGHLSL